ncbi:MAG: SDR family NAD(P)-dependent oxidoreductase, partial [Ruminococcus sp.]|nr:SDR family NAD(P)-dependent oxidoreductase [Ruminococcus sp.]
MKICLICRQRNMENYGICPECSALNEKMRSLTCDLSGKTAVVTGGRIKIGYAVCLKLLRMGASVIAVTRYPKNALESYSHEPDFENFRDRLFIIGFDLMRVDRIDELIEQIGNICNCRLDILINNAAQTVKKSSAYYSELEMKENSIEDKHGFTRILSLCTS